MQIKCVCSWDPRNGRNLQYFGELPIFFFFRSNLPTWIPKTSLDGQRKTKEKQQQKKRRKIEIKFQHTKKMGFRFCSALEMPIFSSFFPFDANIVFGLVSFSVFDCLFCCCSFMKHLLVHPFIIGMAFERISCVFFCSWTQKGFQANRKYSVWYFP